MERTQRAERNMPRGGNDTEKDYSGLVKILVSLVGFAYSALLVFFAYASFFFSLEYENKALFAVVGAIISVGVCFLDFFTRRTLITCFLGMVNMVLLFPTIVLDFGNWPLIIPAAIVTLFGFFCCHMNETVKTVFGTIFLLMYIIGGVAFYFIFNFFEVNTDDTLIDVRSSESGAFRSYTLDVKNKASGKYVVYISPNTLDKDYKMFRLNTTIKKMIFQVNKPAEIECKWEGENLYINGEIFFTESEYSASFGSSEVIYDLYRGNWLYTRFELDYPLSDTIDKLKSKLLKKKNSGDTSDVSAADGSDGISSEADGGSPDDDEGSDDSPDIDD